MDTSRRGKLEDKHSATQETQDIYKATAGRGRQDLPPVGEDDRRGRPGSRSHGELAQEVVEAGRDRRAGLERQRPADERGAAGTQSTAQGESRPADGARLPKKSGGVLRSRKL